jgi:hypothetical protein
VRAGDELRIERLERGVHGEHTAVSAKGRRRKPDRLQALHHGASTFEAQTRGDERRAREMRP